MNGRIKLFESINHKRVKESKYSRYASTDEQESAINELETTLSKLGKRVVGGTTIGKYPQTVVLDLTYQGGEIRIHPRSDEGYSGVSINDIKIQDLSDEHEVDRAINYEDDEDDDKVESSYKSSKNRKIKESTDSESNLSPDMFDVYDNAGSVPIQLQLVRKAITQETQAISEYELMKKSMSAEDKVIIDEIINDEKDHIVNFTTMLTRLTTKNYPNNGDLPDSVNVIESVSKSNKIKLFK